MAKQDRAIRTRRKILEAAADVFEEHGYQAATIADILASAGVTKGAMYFHFPSKEHLAQGVMAEQDQRLVVSPQSCKVQEIADLVFLQAYLLRIDPMVRAGIRLSLDQQAAGLDRSGPFVRWTAVVTEHLEQARQQGELLPQVVIETTASLLVGAFAGVQSMSETLSGYEDLPERASDLLRQLLPSVVHPSVLAALSLAPDRGAEVFARAKKAVEAQEPTDVSA